MSFIILGAAAIAAAAYNVYCKDKKLGDGIAEAKRMTNDYHQHLIDEAAKTQAQIDALEARKGRR